MTTINKVPENLDDALIDVETRFLYSLPESDLSKPDRLFFQIEQAYWYYEDFKADRYSHLPHFSHLKSFAKQIFDHCDLLKDKSNQFPELFGSYSSYKAKIPVCGCILLNPTFTKVVLVCNWDGKSWSFPRGKIDEKETEYACAMREVYEETGFNPSSYCNENEFLITFQEQKKIQLFIGMNIPEDTIFQSRTRKEISKIEFFEINNLPKSTFLVHPFIPKLKRWIEKKQKVLNRTLLKSPNLLGRSTTAAAGSGSGGGGGNITILKKGQSLVGLATPNRKLKEKNNNNNYHAGDREMNDPTPTRLLKRRNSSHTIDAKNVDTFALFPILDGDGNPKHSGEEYLENMNSETYRWSVEEMFKANSRITGKEYDYDGNPHSFGSSHPKFVNYRNYNELVKHTTAATKGPESDIYDMNFMNLSLQSQQLGEKFLRGNKKDERGGGGTKEFGVETSRSFNEKEFELFRLPHSTTSAGGGGGIAAPPATNRSSFFQVPFYFNKKEIMAEIDAVLMNFSFE